MRAYIAIIGLALGSIIATIITVHIMKTSHQAAAACGRTLSHRAAIAGKSPGVIGIRMR